MKQPTWQIFSIGDCRHNFQLRILRETIRSIHPCFVGGKNSYFYFINNFLISWGSILKVILENQQIEIKSKKVPHLKYGQPCQFNKKNP